MPIGEFSGQTVDSQPFAIMEQAIRLEMIAYEKPPVRNDSRVFSFSRFALAIEARNSGHISVGAVKVGSCSLLPMCSERFALKISGFVSRRCPPDLRRFNPEALK